MIYLYYSTWLFTEQLRIASDLAREACQWWNWLPKGSVCSATQGPACGSSVPPAYFERLVRAAKWDRSSKWSQLRSPRWQRTGWLGGVRGNRRVRRRRSARCEKRGVRSSQECGVAELGTDGPARRSRLVSPAWWTGPPPIPRRRPPRATNRMTRPPRRSPPREAARGFWIRAWSLRGSALQGTGRSNEPAQSPGSLEGGLDDPRHSRPNNSLRIEHPIRTLTYRTLVTRRSNQDLCLSCDNCLLE